MSTDREDNQIVNGKRRLISVAGGGLVFAAVAVRYGSAVGETTLSSMFLSMSMKNGSTATVSGISVVSNTTVFRPDLRRCICRYRAAPYLR